MAKIFYYEVDDFLRKEDRYKLLENSKNVYGIEWQEINPNKNHIWLTEGMEDDWESMISIGNKESKQLAGAGGRGAENFNAIFGLYSRGVVSGRDIWAFNFNLNLLSNNILNTIDFYNNHVIKYHTLSSNDNIDSFVLYDDTKISWSRDLKLDLKRNKLAFFSNSKLKTSFYRPFTKKYLYFDRILNEEIYQFHHIFPTDDCEKENFVICVSGLGSSKPFHALIANLIPELSIVSTSQCFPFYTYDEDGTNRKENISDWSLDEFQKQYKDEKITKWDILYYIYGVLHKPEYREKYAANLKRELPRIPFYDDFWKYSNSGKKLAHLHVNYETQEEYYLEKIESPGKQLDYKVEKMKYNKDKTAIIYNDFLTLSGIPIEAHNYKLGNRSALDWIVDQYQVKTDKRSGISNDPNRLDEPDYIIKLIGKIVTVSVETVNIVEGLK